MSGGNIQVERQSFKRKARKIGKVVLGLLIVVLVINIPLSIHLWDKVDRIRRDTYSL
jgi:hypothetical protein